MTETLTIRLEAAQRRALRARAAGAGKTESQLVREFISNELQDGEPLGKRAGEFFGCLDFSTAGGRDPWRAHLEAMNRRK